MTAKLKQLEELNLIEKANGSIRWINPLAPVERPNQDICICLDMRQTNRGILREKHLAHTVEETLQEISEVKVFSKPDLNLVFYQIELHPNSHDVTTFTGPAGGY